MIKDGLDRQTTAEGSMTSSLIFEVSERQSAASFDGGHVPGTGQVALGFHEGQPTGAVRSRRLAPSDVHRMDVSKRCIDRLILFNDN